MPSLCSTKPANYKSKNYRNGPQFTIPTNFRAKENLTFYNLLEQSQIAAPFLQNFICTGT